MKIYNKSIIGKVNPLPIPTPFIDGESITSWLLRAAFNQGCDYSAILFYHWSEYKLSHADFDKGFNQIDLKIQNDLAVLMNSDKEFLDNQTLIHYNQKLGIEFQKNNKLKWIIPIGKFDSKKTNGYPYCFHCFREGEEHLKLKWRYSWFVYCDKHHLQLSDTCPHCDKPYQPHLIKLPQHSLIQCPHCHKDLTDALTNLLVKVDAYKLQSLASQVLDSGQGIIFGQSWESKDWFELILFYINFIRKGLVSDENSLYRRTLNRLVNDIRGVKLEKVKSGLAFDLLTIHERIMLMSYANQLLNVELDKWMKVLIELGFTQSSLRFGKNPVIPKPFLLVHDQLPIPIKQSINREAGNHKMKPKSTKAVLLSWERLQLKIDKVKTHGEIRANRKLRTTATA